LITYQFHFTAVSISSALPDISKRVFQTVSRENLARDFQEQESGASHSTDCRTFYGAWNFISSFGRGYITDGFGRGDHVFRVEMSER